ncbi:MAG: hypothetical protein JNM71_06590 [Flavobacterium lindanitolerans]|uniref:hypothetical protein n=1 Tax=Flavobacterium lindanitolerans TaxID=428988 RepID=UPI001A4FC668|nr:hypothetical protein [Flavobacterium lindanitolerans]MBL7867671.1 hypothetical protein [Flavobacterium lindanitolerans]
MKYKFSIQKVSQAKYFDVEIETAEHYVLNNFTDSDWTPQIVQSIIYGVDKSKNNDPEKSFVWGNEDIYIRSNKYGVFFIDLMAQRAGRKLDKQDLVLDHPEFIDFMKDFKKFVEQNS